MKIFLKILLIYLIIISQQFNIYSRIIIVDDKIIETKKLNNKQINNKALPNEKQKQKNREEFAKKVQNVPIKDDHVEAIFQHWADQAYSSLFAAIANQRLKTLKKPIRDDFGNCSKHATNIPLHAKCLSELFKGNFKEKNVNEKKNGKLSRLERYKDKKYFVQRASVIEMRNKLFQKLREESNKNMIKQPRKKLLIKEKNLINSTKNNSKDHPTISTTNFLQTNQPKIIKLKNFNGLHSPSMSRLSPLGRIARDLMKKVLKAKGRHEKDIIPWQKTVERLRDSAKRRKELKKNFNEGEDTEIGQLTYRGLKRQGIFGDDEDLNEIAENPQKIFKFLEKLRSENFTKKKKKEPVGRLVQMLREGIKLGYALAGHNASEIDNKTMRMVSPRFFSVTAEDEYNDTNLTSIPSIINTIGGPIGFSSKDQQMWLDLELNATSKIGNLTSSEIVLPKQFNNTLYEKEIRAKDGTPLFFTKDNITDVADESEIKKFEIFEHLQNSFNKQQLKDMNRTGYSLLTKDQLIMLYGKNSSYDDPKLFQRFASLNKSTLLSLIQNDIHKLAQLKSFKITPKKSSNNRRKRQAIVLSPISFTPFINTFIVNTPLILSPLIFSPLVLAPVVLGPLVLSPTIFVPLILSPRLLSPFILSPSAFDPFILSPIALNPFILTPGAFIPFVLSPFLLSPFILSPQVFTPVILSPLALTPFILTPAAASPLVLSPFVLSPIIYSPMFLSALVLSPYALSPVIHSPLIAFSVILSPSYLS
ncbi:hypothetical protein Mgra_00003804 [Meloidogyne graminicola]|uniref:Moulting cycle MLT-10-like protein family-containing protein n=1 Tax=Meloidogyne graminicola TaxID=189291 RepID=A0A8S9ZV41_9BILA|nr:hypothetical protein Mgra_00003804 [Meloidogyne graminicola]